MKLLNHCSGYSEKVKIKALFLIFNLFICALALGQNYTITEKNIRFIDYPGFPNANSTWGDIGFSSKYNAVYIGVTNHVDSIAMYEYSIDHDNMVFKGFIGDLANLRNYQWQGKIHTKIVEGPDGCMYFGTDGGESREEYLMEHPHGYAGSFFMKWDPSADKLSNLGSGLQYESIKDVEIDFETGNIYAVSYPQVHFLIYNPESNKLRDLGRLGSSHVPRVMFTDRWGNCYYVDWRQRLVMYDKSKDKLVFAKESLPAFQSTPGSKIITGITAFAHDEKNNTIYLITYGAKIIAFHPQKTGIGKVEDLGGVVPEGFVDPMWEPYCPNLSFADNGKLYYAIGGHGNYVIDEKVVFMEFDPQSKTHKIIYEFPLTVASEVTGSNVRDKEGNLYFAVRKHVAKDGAAGPGEDESEGYGYLPLMMIFNPEKEVAK